MDAWTGHSPRFEFESYDHLEMLIAGDEGQPVLDRGGGNPEIVLGDRAALAAELVLDRGVATRRGPSAGADRAVVGEGLGAIAVLRNADGLLGTEEQLSERDDADRDFELALEVVEGLRLALEQRDDDVVSRSTSPLTRIDLFAALFDRFAHLTRSLRVEHAGMLQERARRHAPRSSHREGVGQLADGLLEVGRESLEVLEQLGLGGGCGHRGSSSLESTRL